MFLNDFIEKHFKIDAKKREGLNKLKIKTIEDLLFYLPFRYETVSFAKNISSAVKGDFVFAQGIISKIRSRRAKKTKSVIEAYFSNESGEIKIFWFNRPYLIKNLSEGKEIFLSGKVSQSKNGICLVNPVFKKEDYFAPREDNNNSYNISGNKEKEIYPIYSEARGISSKWLNFAVLKILKSINESETRDFLPQNIIKKYHLPEYKKSLFFAHFPKNIRLAEAARKRFAFQEVFLIQLKMIKEKMLKNLKPAFKMNVNYEDLHKFIKQFNFDLTGAQKKAVYRIAEDFKKNNPMARLLHGDVGSGKTIVALAASFIAVKNGYQTAYMAPTEILARQHFETFTEIFKNSGFKIGLITSSLCEKFPSKAYQGKTAPISKARLLKWAEEGEINMLIGTHSLIQDKIKFKNLAFAVIDEQHRFGVGQRARLIKNKLYGNINKEKNVPHLLSMTATPIPRTLALTIYGDLDITLLDEMPPDRKQVMTYIVPPNEKYRAYEQIREEVNLGRQAYFVCPRIEAAEKNSFKETREMKAVKEESEKLKKEIYPEFKIAALHGKLTPKEKNKIMADFKNKKIHIIVSTSVIEVGIDVPNANCMFIEGADRFGLAQLHQLRGRVARSENQAHCFIASESNSIKVLQRLLSLKKAKNGFELAEYDLKFRGPGELYGKKQWGVSDIYMEALRNIKMVEAARAEAEKILKEDPEFKNHPLLKERVEKRREELHLE